MNKLLVGAILSLLMVGCVPTQSTAPTFNPNNKSIMFFKGKPFLMPSGTKYMAGTGTIYNSWIKGLKDMGKDCRTGDLIWMQNKYINAIISEKDPQKKSGIKQIMKTQNRVGCSHPLSDKEFSYYRQKEAQNTALRAAQISSHKTVEHTGYIQSFHVPTYLLR